MQTMQTTICPLLVISFRYFIWYKKRHLQKTVANILQTQNPNIEDAVCTYLYTSASQSKPDWLMDLVGPRTQDRLILYFELINHGNGRLIELRIAYGPATWRGDCVGQRKLVPQINYVFYGTWPLPNNLRIRHFYRPIYYSPRVNFNYCRRYYHQ